MKIDNEWLSVLYEGKAQEPISVLLQDAKFNESKISVLLSTSFGIGSNKSHLVWLNFDSAGPSDQLKKKLLL